MIASFCALSPIQTMASYRTSHRAAHHRYIVIGKDERNSEQPGTFSRVVIQGADWISISVAAFVARIAFIPITVASTPFFLFMFGKTGSPCAMIFGIVGHFLYLS